MISRETYQKKRGKAQCHIFDEFISTHTMILNFKKKYEPTLPKNKVLKQEEEVEFNNNDYQIYLETWSNLVLKCKNASDKFIGNLDSVVAEILAEEKNQKMKSLIEVPLDNSIEEKNKKGKKKLNFKILEDAIDLIEESAVRSFTFYRHVFRQLPIETAVNRIKETHGNLTVWTKFMLRAWWEMETKDFFQYLIVFLGPVGVAVALTSLGALSLTGWGAIILLCGGLLAPVGVIMLRKWNDHQRNQIENTLKKKQEEAKLFFERWNQLDAKVDVENIFLGLEYLKQSKDSFDTLCIKLFPEIQITLSLCEDCFVCSNPLVPSDELERQQQEQHIFDPKNNLITDLNNYISNRNDVVTPSSCPLHYIHFGCLQNWRESPCNKNKNECPLCRKEYKEIHVVWISPNEEEEEEEDDGDLTCFTSTTTEIEINEFNFDEKQNHLRNLVWNKCLKRKKKYSLSIDDEEEYQDNTKNSRPVEIIGSLPSSSSSSSFSTRNQIPFSY